MKWLLEMIRETLKVDATEADAILYEMEGMDLSFSNSSKAKLMRAAREAQVIIAERNAAKES